MCRLSAMLIRGLKGSGWRNAATKRYVGGGNINLGSKIWHFVDSARPFYRTHLFPSGRPSHAYYDWDAYDHCRSVHRAHSVSEPTKSWMFSLAVSESVFISNQGQ